MKRYSYIVAAVPVLALGCAPTAQGGGGDGGSAVSSTIELRASRETSCEVCSAALGGDEQGDVCRPSQIALTTFLSCACDTTCASVCGGAPGNCLTAWAGNPPLACKTCLVSATGCGAAWTACLTDDGITIPPAGSSSASSGGGACSCDPALPLCPGGGSCSTPGAHDEPGNASCGSARYCAPCCDPGNACAIQGTCKLTRIAQAPCSADYECCSGVCTAGACDGGCGIVISF